MLEFEDTKNTDLDIVIFNLDNKIQMESKQYIDNNLLLNELGALMTCAAVNVINSKIVQKIS